MQSTSVFIPGEFWNAKRSAYSNGSPHAFLFNGWEFFRSLSLTHDPRSLLSPIKEFRNHGSLT